MGRKKTVVKPIKNPKVQNVTFVKRRAGLLKKAMELSIMCECSVTLLVEGKDGERSQYSSRTASQVAAALGEFSQHPFYSNSDYAKLYQSESGGVPDITTSSSQTVPQVPIAPATSPTTHSHASLKRPHEESGSASSPQRKKPRTASQQATDNRAPSPQVPQQVQGGPFIPVQFPNANGGDPITMMIPLFALPMIGAYYAQMASAQTAPQQTENQYEQMGGGNSEQHEDDHQSPSERDNYFPSSFELAPTMDGDAIDPLDVSPNLANSSTNIRKSDDELRIAIPPRQKGYILSPLHSEHSPPISARTGLTRDQRGSETKEKEKDSPPVRMVTLPASFGAQGGLSAQSLFSPSLMTPTTDFSAFNFTSGGFTPNSALLPGTPLSWFLPPIPTQPSAQSSSSSSSNSSSKPSSD